RKDLKEATQNKSVWLPMLVIPIMFVILLPVVLILVVGSSGSASQSMLSDPDMATFFARMPEVMKESLAGLNAIQSGTVMMLGYFFAPFFLIMPLMYSTVIAAESFAGERERKTVEALLYTPVKDAELFIGKVLASFIPAVLITLGSFLVYIIVLNTFGYRIMGRVWFPLPNWYALILWVSPAISLLGTAFTVLISTKVQTFMGAYQSSASLVVLVLGLLAGQATGVLYLSPLVSLLLGAGIWLVDVILVYFAVKSFNRAKLIASAGS
ncbi:MAG TPA: ABC transporter permease subunit, partial [Anaerolineaceae bacterium]|nr:ABC transporter permease subunit [Anaerolineaceae bacterium]